MMPSGYQMGIYPVTWGFVFIKMHVRAKGMANTRIRPISIHLAQAFIPNYAQLCLGPWVLPTYTSTTQTITCFFQISMATTALHTMVIIL
jgi:hypothetical protein